MEEPKGTGQRLIFGNHPWIRFARGCQDVAPALHEKDSVSPLLPWSSHSFRLLAIRIRNQRSNTDQADHDHRNRKQDFERGGPLSSMNVQEIHCWLSAELGFHCIFIGHLIWPNFRNRWLSLDANQTACPQTSWCCVGSCDFWLYPWSVRDLSIALEIFTTVLNIQ